MPTGTGAGQVVPQIGFGTPNSNTQQTTGMLMTDYYDNRRVSAVDGAAVVLFVAPSIPYTVWDVTMGVHGNCATVSTVTAGTYVLSWASMGGAQSATVAVAALAGAQNKNAAASVTIMPDAASTVTVQFAGSVFTGTATIALATTASRVL